MASSIPAVPALVPVFSMKLQLARAPETLFTDTSKNAISTMALVASGHIATIKNNLGFELDVKDIKGYDNITAHTEKQYNSLDAHLHGKSSSGDDVKIDYFGLFHASPGLLAVLSGEATSHSFEESYLTNSPRITFSGPVPKKFEWIEKENLFGKGRFLVEDGKTYVEYFTYVVR